jgi:NAD(P)-dependent dehydrogenase (short-subunit alcohol dehydrogenase family)
MKLEGSIALVTGTNRGLGRGFVQVNQVSRWVLAYEKSLAEFAQLLANAAELRALYDPSSPQR